jgi:hypothetical protein
MGEKIKQILYFLNILSKINPHIYNTTLINNLKVSEYYKEKITPNINNYKNLILINSIKYLILKKKLLNINKYKYYISMLYFNNIKFSINNMLNLIQILSKIYNKQVNLNIINLKYFYLDNNILADAIVRKLNDRKKRVLRVMRKILHYVKFPIINVNYKKNSAKINTDYLNYNLSNYLNNNLIIALKNLEHKYLINLKFQGSGRLTKRLTASRAIIKRRQQAKTIYQVDPGVKYKSKLLEKKISTPISRGYLKSNIQYLNINSYNRNGSFGFKS